MSSHDFTQLIDEITKRRAMIMEYLFADETRITFAHSHLEQAVYSYINAGGKSLRPAVLMFCCGAVGGDEKTAIPAAAAIELYHTFTLIHDDIIDHDEMRRNVPTIHVDYERRGKDELGLSPEAAQNYGLAIAILSGDIQQGWAASILPDLYHKHGLPPELALNLVQELFHKTQITLINGETTDVMQSQMPVDQLTEEQVLSMLQQKTGALYEFAGRAGAAIGLRQADLKHPTVEAIAAFTGRCGIAFQIQDDILGIIGDEKRLGKPIGSDIREGKRTIIILHSLPLMTKNQREFTLKILGNRLAKPSDIQEVSALLQSLGGIDHAKNIAAGYLQEAIAHLNVIENSIYKTLLETWANYITERTL